MVFGNVSVYPVLLATVAYFILGWLWYGPLFGKPWMKEMKITEKDMKKVKQKSMVMPMIFNFVATFISLWVFAYLFSATGATRIVEGIYLAVVVWLGFFATMGIGSILWEGRSLRLFLINQSYHLIGLLIAGLLVGSL